ncbi:MAG: hypothetical protein Q9205_001946 [Flavoplaca limonia]
MGSRDFEVPTKIEEVTVLVTGFGPFGNNRINPSHLIVDSLPSCFTANGLPNIRIVTASPIPVHYRTVRDIVPRFLFPISQEKVEMKRSYPLDIPSSLFQTVLGADSTPDDKPRFDYILHIGMAAPREYFTMETCAHRDRYLGKDESGETMEGDTLWRDEYKAPELLRPGFDAEDVWRRWKSELAGVDVRPSSDAGRYLCDFIYYTSLVEYWRKDPKMMAPVMFLHVPGSIEDHDIEMGKKAALGLIGAMKDAQLHPNVVVDAYKMSLSGSKLRIYAVDEFFCDLQRGYGKEEDDGSLTSGSRNIERLGLDDFNRDALTRLIETHGQSMNPHEDGGCYFSLLDWDTLSKEYQDE